MPTNIVVGQDLTPDWLKRRTKAFAEIDRQLVQAFESPGNGLTLGHIQLLIEHKNPFPVMDEILLGWKMFYKELFGIECDFANLAIPKRKKGFDRLIVVAKGMTPMKLYAKVKELCPAWKYMDNLDPITSERKADRDYTIWVRDRVEADEELKNLSASDLKAKDVPGITLEERLLYELKFFKEAGKHLDVTNVTLCSGSRNPDGSVPNVTWDGSKVRVGWYDPDDQGGRLRSRQAVS
jgi:hypothetical protein